MAEEETLTMVLKLSAKPPKICRFPGLPTNKPLEFEKWAKPVTVSKVKSNPVVVRRFRRDNEKPVDKNPIQIADSEGKSSYHGTPDRGDGGYVVIRRVGTRLEVHPADPVWLNFRRTRPFEALGLEQAEEAIRRSKAIADYDLKGPAAITLGKVAAAETAERPVKVKGEKSGKRKIDSATLWGGAWQFDMEEGENEFAIHRADDEEDIMPERGRDGEEEAPPTPPVAIEEEARPLDDAGKELKKLLGVPEDDEEDEYLLAFDVEEDNNAPPPPEVKEDEATKKRKAAEILEANKKQKIENDGELSANVVKEVLRKNGGKISTRGLLTELKPYLKDDKAKELLKSLIVTVCEKYTEVGRPFLRLKSN